jgi:DNA-binding transcriptional ArsR family regulator
MTQRTREPAGWEAGPEPVLTFPLTNLTIVNLMSNYCLMTAGTQLDQDVAPLFGALSDATRRQVVQLLGAGPRRAGELATAAGTTAPAMSRHLRVLLQAGIIADERTPQDARARVFRLEPQSMVALQAWLDQLQAHWDAQLQSFKRHVEGRTAQ